MIEFAKALIRLVGAQSRHTDFDAGAFMRPLFCVEPPCSRPLPCAGALPDDSLLPPAPIVALEELVGLGACAWIVVQFGLTEPEVRADFLRRGRLRAVTRP